MNQENNMQPSYLLSSVIFLQLILLQVTRVTSDDDSDNDSDDDSNDQCRRQLSCSDCIQLVQCVYCLDANFSREVSIIIKGNLHLDGTPSIRAFLSKSLHRSGAFVGKLINM